MDEDTSGGRPIPFIEIETDAEEGKTYFNLNPNAVQILQDLKDKRIGVMVIAGPQRSGKSFLANKLINQVDGFQLGSSVQPCTKGIWMWSEPIKLSEDHDFETIILDTEGLNSVQRDKSIDTKLFTLSILLSSMFVYNSIGMIDESALEDLSLVVNLAKYIDAKREGELKQDAFSSFFPFFVWTLRDFSLDLKGLSPVDYLNKCLKPVDTQENNLASQKNEIRRAVNNYFPFRDCFTLIRPVNDESKLRKIQELSSKEIKPEFNEQVEAMRDRVIKNMSAKLFEGKSITGTMLLNLAFEYCDALNNDIAPQVYSTVERVLFAETRKICDDLIMEFYDAVDDEFSQKQLPQEDDYLRARHNEISQDILRRFETTTKHYAETVQLVELRSEMEDKILKDLDQRLQQNEELSTSLCNRLINEFLNSQQIVGFANMDDIPESILMEFKDQFFLFYDTYAKFAKGVKKYQYFADQMPNFVFKFFEEYSKHLNRVKQEEINDVKAFLQQSRDREETLRKTLDNQSLLVIEIQKEKDEARRVMEKNMRENDLNLMKKQDEMRALNDRARDLEEKIQRKREKKKEWKSKFNKMQEQFDKIRIEKDMIKKAEVRASDRVRELEKKILSGNSSGSGMNDSSFTSNNSEFPDLITGLLSQIDEVKKGLNSDTGKSLEEELIKKEEEIVVLKKEFNERIEDNWKKLKNIKQDYQGEIEQLRRQLENQLNENTKLKVQLVGSNQSSDANSKKDALIQNLKQQNHQLNEEINLLKSQAATNAEVTELFKKQVEHTQVEKIKMEESLAELKSQNAYYKNLKGEMIYLMRECVKRAKGKNHELKSIMPTLEPELQQEVRDIMNEIGKKISY